MSASETSPTFRRLFMVDRRTKTQFLIDTGADLCVVTRGLVIDHGPKSSYELSAANGTPIATYGTATITLNLGLRREFIWRFVVADVSKPIIGADFLAHFGLLVDIRNQDLIDSTTSLRSKDTTVRHEVASIKTVANESIFHQLLQKYPDLTKPGGTPVEVNHDTCHYIKTTPGPPVSCRPRRLAPDRLQFAKKEFEIMLRLGIARPSKSSWSSALHLVPKGSGEDLLRAVGDYRGVNARSIPDRYPIRHIEDFAQALRGKRIFSTVALMRAYNQIPVAEEDIPKTAITTPFGLFEFPFMSFGLRNAAQTFQRFIDEVLRGLDFCNAYIDDILIASASESEHLEHLKILFDRLCKYHLVVNPGKCVFGKLEVMFLGYIVSEMGSRPVSEKVDAINNYPETTTAKQLRRFLGMINFYRRFIPNAAQAQAPLNDMLGNIIKGNSPVTWTDEARDAFRQCKEDLSRATLLAHPELNAPVALTCDASNTMLGASLQQRIGVNWEPLAFFSTKLSPTQRNYSTFDWELLAIYMSNKHFRHLLEGRTFTVFTDHKPLIFAFSCKSVNHTPRQVRHLSYVSQFTTDIRHVAGQDNVVADALSRLDSVEEAIDFEAMATSQAMDPELQDFLQKDSGLTLEQVAVPGGTMKLWCDVSTGRVCPYVTAPFRRAVFNILHGLSHAGSKATIKLVTQRYVRPSVTSDCREWTRSCVPCQLSKVHKHVAAPLGSFPQPSARFEHINIDIVILPVSEGYRYCLTCVDRFTRWPEAFPL